MRLRYTIGKKLASGFIAVFVLFAAAAGFSFYRLVSWRRPSIRLPTCG